MGSAQATAEQATKLISSGALETAGPEFTPRDPTLAGKSEEEIQALAHGVTSAINLQVLKMVLTQVAASVGLSGLIPQVLANIGSLSTDAIIKLINGPVNYQTLSQSPIDQLLLATALVPAFEKNLGLSQQESETIVQQALNSFNQLGPFSTQAAAQTALNQSLVNQLNQSAISPATGQSVVNQAFGSLENPQPSVTPLNTPPAPPDTSSTSPLSQLTPTTDDLQLTPQQQLESALKTAAFANDLKNQLLKSNLEADDYQRVSSGLNVAINQAASLPEAQTAAANVLANGGVENGQQLVNQVATAVSSPLRTPFINQVTPTAQLSNDFTQTVATLNATDGIRSDIAQKQAEDFSNLVFNNPNSVANLVQQNIQEYSNSVKESQTKVATDFFSDTLRPTQVGYVAALKETDPANTLIYLSNPFVGHRHQKAGTGGGVDVSPIMPV